MQLFHTSVKLERFHVTPDDPTLCFRARTVCVRNPVPVYLHICSSGSHIEPFHAVTLPEARLHCVLACSFPRSIILSERSRRAVTSCLPDSRSLVDIYVFYVVKISVKAWSDWSVRSEAVREIITAHISINTDSD